MIWTKTNRTFRQRASKDVWEQKPETSVTHGGGCPTLVAGQETHVVYCLQGNGIDRDDKHGCNGKGYTGGYRTR